MIESNFNDASSSDPLKNSPACSRSRNYIALHRLIKDIVQDKHTQIEKKIKATNKDEFERYLHKENVARRDFFQIFIIGRVKVQNIRKSSAFCSGHCF